MASGKTKRVIFMQNPDSKGTVTCSAYGCDMRSGTNALSEIKMYHFPKNLYRRRRWELATRRAGWKAHTKSRLCSKHFLTGKPSKDPNHPDFVPSLFVFTENADDLKKSFKKKQKKLLRSEADNLEETTSDEVTCVSSSCGKGFCATCFSPESVSSAFNMSLAPLNQTLTQLMGKLKEMEEEREQLRSELASCREEIQQMREAHQHCEVPSQSAGVNPIPNRFVSGRSSTSEDATEILESLYSGELSDVDDPDVLPSLYLEQSYLQPSNKRQKKLSKATISDEVIGIMEQCPMPKKKRAKVSNPKPKDSRESSKSGKSLNTGSPINIVYLKR